MQISETELHMPTLLSLAIGLFYTAKVIKYITIFGVNELSREQWPSASKHNPTLDKGLIYRMRSIQIL
jgi:hypothetical protein